MGDKAEIVARLRDAATPLRTMTDGEVVDSLARALKLWSGEDGLAARAARELAAHRKQSEEMLRFGLERMLEAHSRSALAIWLAEARVEAGRSQAPLQTAHRLWAPHIHRDRGHELAQRAHGVVGRDGAGDRSLGSEGLPFPPHSFCGRRLGTIRKTSGPGARNLANALAGRAAVS